MAQKLLLVVLLAAAPASAAVVPFLTPVDVQKLADIKREMPRWTNVSMRSSSQAEGKFQITEPFLRIFVTGARDANGSFMFSGFTQDGMLMLSARPQSGSYLFFGSGASLFLRPFGNGYSLSGSVDGRPFDVMIERFGNDYRIWGGGGMNLSVWARGGELEIAGSVELERFSTRALATLGAALTVVNAATP